MIWERIRIPLMLAPTMLIIVVLFFGSLGYGFLQSLGYNPQIGASELSLDAYRSILLSPDMASRFWPGLWLSLWVAFASTFISAAIAIAVALLLRRTFVGKKIAVFFFQLNLPIPHLVIAVGMLMLFSQSGLVSRMLGEMGVVTSPRDFPALTKDPYGIGIILAYIWKEVAFFGIIVLAILQSLGEDYESVAQSLGANRWQRFRTVTLPLIMPGLLSASIIVFAFTFGTYEVPRILGVQHPKMLPVLALDFFINPDLNARAEGMALSMIIAAIVFALVFVYMYVSARAVRKD
jgi:putative spermidine/putrescine transport system permease protein